MTAVSTTIRRVDPPRRNIELKARDPDPDRSLQAALALGATDEGWIHQIDTYFRVPSGRLKLREESPEAHLIAYNRADQAAARESRYRIVSISDPEGLKQALAETLGVLVVVEKVRRLLLWQDVPSVQVRAPLMVWLLVASPSRNCGETVAGTAQMNSSERTSLMRLLIGFALVLVVGRGG